MSLWAPSKVLCVCVCMRMLNGRTDRYWTIDMASRGGRLARWPPKSASSTTTTSKAAYPKNFVCLLDPQNTLMSVFYMLSFPQPPYLRNKLLK